MSKRFFATDSDLSIERFATLKEAEGCAQLWLEAEQIEASRTGEWSPDVVLINYGELHGQATPTPTPVEEHDGSISHYEDFLLKRLTNDQ